ncbi:hypothetical protein CONCODRAFT_10617 [Conidiobolus coronatus NRRL 28638]|uniref:Uncharacterized protein n=1 Tax=Conidiobolus coronatus (strain ATCC 28846 / CBS 209.66 / NRRL 28638) TaxID=796925 RepID=A0A137NXJ4_CONC2|nr:hypothetical protein CONCODRAFT_10617 [Conidiobolus coronatus NRRL 28638]|eukprot:KXN67339.1 hypothetical protein CONCODRAFT_10617 [Conidiobolus coronatus NRRL 28638]
MSIVKASGGYSSNHIGEYTSGGSYYDDYGAYDGGYGGYGSGYSSKYYKRGLYLDLGLVGELLGIEEDQKDQKVIVEKLIMPAENEKGQNVINFQKSMQAVRFKQPYTYIPTLRFKVQKDVTGLRYKQNATRAGILIEALDRPLGDFKAKEESYDVKMPSEVISDGVEWQGDFAMVSSVVDGNNVDLIIDTQWEPHDSI